jgi:hypothetical protein
MQASFLSLCAIALACSARGAAAAQTTYISGSWFYGLASCGGKPFTPFNFSVNACSLLDTDDLQVQFKGHSLRLSMPDTSRSTAALVVFSDDACSVQPTKWGSVADGGCQMSYWSTKYTFFTNFTQEQG